MIDIFYAEGIRSLILSIENSLSDFRGMKVRTQAEAALRRKIIDYLEMSEGVLIDCHALLFDAMMCSDDFDLSSLMEAVNESLETEP